MSTAMGLPKPTTGFASDSMASRIAYRIIRSLVCGLTYVITRVHIDGRERLPTTGAYVLAPIHRSYVDTFIVACISRRRLRFMGKQEVWKYRRLGRLFTLLGAFPVNRGTADREALTRCVAVLEAGEPLVLFPEGERKDGSRVHPLFDGAAFVAARAGVPIVPVGIGGSARVMPRHAKMFRPSKVHVVIGEPFSVEIGESGRASRPAIRDASERLSTELQRLFDLAQARVG
jgi:1-acyl-sn-glycerol-3-phosphate acyltransferase